LNDFSKLTDTSPVFVSDELLFRWSRIGQIARLLPVMADVRALEMLIAANSCKSCRKPVEVDRSALNSARRALAECSEEVAKLVKQAAGVVKYKVSYRRLTEPLQEIIR